MSQPKLLAYLLTLPLILAALAATAAPAAAATTGFRLVDITTPDGVDLEANVDEPTTPGKHPAIVFISSWGLNDAEYLAQASDLAGSGYTVLSYTPRGFWGSGGTIQTAGPQDIADASTVITWMLANTTADPAHIGAAGVSYGAGISMIASAFDPRIRAVAAMSGWSDMESSLYGDQTRRLQAAGLLEGLADLTGRPSTELNTILSDFWSDTNIPAIQAFAHVRSAATYAAQINANQPAIFMANAFGDSLFPPNQLVDFYNGLTTPKHLEFAPGDHAVVEATGLIGLDNHVWTSVDQWFDHYLRGLDTNIVHQPPVVLRPITSGGPEYYPDWAHTSAATTRYGLSGKDFWTQTGSLGSSVPTGWSTTIYTGVDTVADGGVALLTNGLGALTGTTPTIWLPAVDRVNGAVWTSSSFGAAKNIRGIPQRHITIKPGSGNGTVVAYLYDEDVLGDAHLITEAPTTWLGAATGHATSIDLRLPATAYTVPAGHSLALVIDTTDPLYLAMNPLAAGVTFTGASYLNVPYE
jgi:predicted acyl esterase